MEKIYFHELDIRSGLRNKRRLKKFLSLVFQKERKTYKQVDIIFCSDQYLLSLNKRFLNHDYYTDTMTFILEENPLAGECYISVDRVKENAMVLDINYQTELVRITLHGCLHLCGYSDKIKYSREQMEKVQERYLNEWLVSRETQIGG